MKLYGCKNIEGRPFRILSNYNLQYAVVETTNKGEPLRAVAFCTDLENAEKKKQSEEKYTIDTKLKIVEVKELL